MKAKAKTTTTKMKAVGSKEQQNWQNHIALVTGANRGIGYEICRSLAQQGCNVILTSRDPDKGLQAAEKLSRDKAINGRILFHDLDITRQQSINDIYHWIIERYGPLDILVNNAGIYLDEGISFI